MAEFGAKIGRKQEEAIIALLSERSVEEAARVSKVPPRTIYRWLNEVPFKTAYREAKRAAYSQAIARLHQMSNAAATVLGKVMVDANTPPATKVRAAEAILSHTAKAIEIEDIEARVAELERVAQANSPQGSRRL
jgi:hypothetical protein